MTNLLAILKIAECPKLLYWHIKCNLNEEGVVSSSYRYAVDGREKGEASEILSGFSLKPFKLETSCNL